MKEIFQICVKIMEVFASLIGATYEEANTYLFLYLQPLLLALSALVLLWVAVKKCRSKVTIGKLILATGAGIEFTLLSVLAVFVWNHYAPYSAHNACLHSYKDLAYLGKATGMGYIGVNLFLFVLMFLIIFFGNLLLARLFSKYLK